LFGAGGAGGLAAVDARYLAAAAGLLRRLLNVTPRCLACDTGSCVHGARRSGDRPLDPILDLRCGMALHTWDEWLHRARPSWWEVVSGVGKEKSSDGQRTLIICHFHRLLRRGLDGASGRGQNCRACGEDSSGHTTKKVGASVSRRDHQPARAEKGTPGSCGGLAQRTVRSSITIPPPKKGCDSRKRYLAGPDRAGCPK